MMDCRLAESLLGDYLDDELSLELRDQLEGHLLRCRACAWQAESLRITLSALRVSALPNEPSEGFRARLLVRLLQEQCAANAGVGLPALRISYPVVFELARKEHENAEN